MRALNKMDVAGKPALSRSLKNARGAIVVHLMLYQLKFYKTLVLIKREKLLQILNVLLRIYQFFFYLRLC